MADWEFSKRQVTLIGHPTAPIGMGELLRSICRAFQAARSEPSIIDVYGPRKAADSIYLTEFQKRDTHCFSDDINLFCINGDEVEPVLEALDKRGIIFGQGRNIICPAWELSRYPREWAVKFERFDEIWACSEFVRASIAASTDVPVVHMPLACEVRRKSLTTRRAFGIPEGSFTFLFAFDYLSYLQRKNPSAVIEAFRRACRELPNEDMCLVLKSNNSARRPDSCRELLKQIEDSQLRVTIIDSTLADSDMKALMDLCDCFVSLHRSEGFGFGISEAMLLGKPVIATGYSGNMDFCNSETAHLVDYELIPVREGDYPHYENQVWAEPNIEAAAAAMARVARSDAEGMAMGQRARVRIKRDFSYRATGLRYVARCRQLLEANSDSLNLEI